jgi:hypothetical protein
MKVYVAGPMRGYPEFNFPAFMAAEEVLKLEGHEVFNPARRDLEVHPEIEWAETTGEQAEVDKQGFLIREAMQADMEFIARHADAVCVLDGWEGSKGARAEVALADALGLPVYTLDTFRLGGESEEVAEKLHPALAAVQEAPRWNGVGALKQQEAPPVIETGWQPVIDPETVAAVRAQFGELHAARFVERREAEVRSVSESGAMKGVKLARFDLIPVKALTALAEHYGRTAHKYPPNNWRKGFEWSKSYAAILRHLTQWWDGESLDVDPAWPEGSPHLAAVAWHALTLLEYVLTKTGVDDRP